MLAASATLVAFFAAGIGVLAIGTSGCACMVFASVGMVVGMGFSLGIPFSCPFGARSTGFFTSATPSSLGFGGGGYSARGGTGVALLAVQVGVGFTSAGGGAGVLHQHIFRCGGGCAGLRIGRSEKAGEGEDAEKVLHELLLFCFYGRWTCGLQR